MIYLEQNCLINIVYNFDFNFKNKFMSNDDNYLITKRKIAHLEAMTNDKDIERNQSNWDKIQLIHRALPEIDFNQIDTSCYFLDKKLSFPLIISSMTGGIGQEIEKINKNLAIAAQKCQIAMAVGSQRIIFETKNSLKSFEIVRHFAPEITLLANLGAVQLNYGFTELHCQKAIDLINADGLYLHLNPLQEVIQPEGNVNFANLSQKIGLIAKSINKPLILKEVGAGLSLFDIDLTSQIGIKYFDIAGRGGTSWARIEHNRRANFDDDLGLILQDWGLETSKALKMAKKAYPNQHFIASGGIRNGVDMAKAIILGADVCAIAAPLLFAAQISAEAVIVKINQLKKQYQTAMFLLGATNHNALFNQSKFLLNE